MFGKLSQRDCSVLASVWGLAAALFALTLFESAPAPLKAVLFFAVFALFVLWALRRCGRAFAAQGAQPREAASSSRPQASRAPAVTRQTTREPVRRDKPAPLVVSHGGAPDDLKKIKGIGPKLEAMLHGMGVRRYDQIAGWTEAELAWIDDNLEGFRGRASRDQWIEQARALAAGRTTEFAARVEASDVPTSQA